MHTILETMIYNSLHYYDRLCRTIESSSTLLQLETTEKLLDLFRRRESEHPELHEKLQVLFTDKAEQLHYFDWKVYKKFGAEAA